MNDTLENKRRAQIKLATELALECHTPVTDISWLHNPFSYHEDLTVLFNDHGNKLTRNCTYNRQRTLLRQKVYCTVKNGKTGFKLALPLRAALPYGRPTEVGLHIGGMGPFTASHSADRVWAYPDPRPPVTMLHLSTASRPRGLQSDVVKMTFTEGSLAVAAVFTPAMRARHVTITVQVVQMESDDGRCTARVVALPALLAFARLISNGADAVQTWAQYAHTAVVGTAQPEWLTNTEWQSFLDDMVRTGQPATVATLPPRLHNTIYESLTLACVAGACADMHAASIKARLCVEHDWQPLEAAVVGFKRGVVDRVVVLDKVLEAVRTIAACCLPPPSGQLRIKTISRFTQTPAPVLPKPVSPPLVDVSPAQQIYQERAVVIWTAGDRVPMLVTPHKTVTAWALGGVNPCEKEAAAAVWAAVLHCDRVPVPASHVQYLNVRNGEVVPCLADVLHGPADFVAAAHTSSRQALAGSPVWMSLPDSSYVLWDYRVRLVNGKVHVAVHALEAARAEDAVPVMPYPWMCVYWPVGETTAPELKSSVCIDDSFEACVKRAAVRVIARTFSVEVYGVLMADGRVVHAYTNAPLQEGYRMPAMPPGFSALVSPDGSVAVSSSDGNIHPVYCLPYSLRLQVEEPELCRFYPVMEDGSGVTDISSEAHAWFTTPKPGLFLSTCNVGGDVIGPYPHWRWSAQPACVHFTPRPDGVTLSISSIAPILPPFVAVSDSQGLLCQVVDQRDGGCLYRRPGWCDVVYCPMPAANTDWSCTRLLCVFHLLQHKPA
jgi:hypothetical protein